jgi:hypothetical protein
VPQIKQIPVTLIPLDRLLFSVARAFDAALKAKVFTFGGTSADQMRFQQVSLLSGLALVVAKEHYTGQLLNVNLYALRTVKIPDFSGCHAMISSSRRLEGLILSIASASIGKNLDLTNSSFHSP